VFLRIITVPAFFLMAQAAAMIDKEVLTPDELVLSRLAFPFSDPPYRFI
jgi:hypothetical protein